MLSKNGLLLLVLVMLVFLKFAYGVLDADEDLVPDEQERLDGTDPEDARDNALFLNIEGETIVGNTIALSIEHPSLGKIPGIEFSIKSKSKHYRIKSDSNGIAKFKIESAGIHYITASKKNFLLEAHFIPKCKIKEKTIQLLPMVSLFANIFTGIIVALLTFLIFFSIFSIRFAALKGKRANVFASFIALSVVVANIFFLSRFSAVLIHISLFLETVVCVLVAWFLKAKGILRKMLVHEKPGQKQAEMGIFRIFKVLPIWFHIQLLRLQEFFLAKRLAFESKLHLARVSKIKRDVSKSKKGLIQAIEATAKEEEKSKLQEHLHRIQAEIERLNQAMHKALAMKRELEQKEEKTIEEHRAEKELELMLADIADQLARELNVPELPEKIEPTVKKESIFSKLISRFKSIRKARIAREPNICLSIYDEYNKPLDASKAEFYLGGNKIEPIKTVANKAYFYFSRTVVELYTRFLGFVDGYSLIEPGASLQEIEVKLKPTILLNIVDEQGNALKDAFITILDERGAKIEDIYSNSIWKTPFPSNASEGIAAIPINPASLKYATIKIKVVRAGFQSKEVTVPSARITTEAQYAKTIVLERIAETSA